jgi:hypothetical protein
MEFFALAMPQSSARHIAAFQITLMFEPGCGLDRVLSGQTRSCLLNKPGWYAQCFNIKLRIDPGASPDQVSGFECLECGILPPKACLS